MEAQARRRRSPSFASTPPSKSSGGVSGGGGGGGSAGREKRSRGRERAESNLMPPWQDVNADIMCQHGGLARSSQGTRGKVCCISGPPASVFSPGGGSLDRFLRHPCVGEVYLLFCLTKGLDVSGARR